ncbi:Facilitated trehalose transporter Tret1 [Blattella germanica]|nr:Facilitated trehalose transporter Tret1 [Blattella germanica]
MLVQCPKFVPARWLQFLAAASAALTFLIVGTGTTWPSPTYSKLKESLDSEVTPSQWAWAISLVGVGGFITPLPTGYLMNRYGRKSLLLASVPFFLLSWILIIFARTISGFGVGIVFSVCPVYLAEIAEDDIRGILDFFLQPLMQLSLVSNLRAGARLPCSSASLIVLSFSLHSPRFYCMHKQTEKAEAALIRLRGGKDQQQIKEELNCMQKVVEEEMTQRSRPKDLIATQGTRRAVLLMFGLIITQQFGGVMAIMSNAHEIFRTSGGSILDPSLSAIVIGVIQLFASIVASSQVDRVGRRILLLISTAGCTISLAVLGTYQFLTLKIEADTSSFNWLPLVCLVLFLVTYCLGIGPLPIAYAGEIFPSNVRGLALSIASMSLSLSFIVVTKLYQVVVDAAGVYVTFWFFSAVSLAGTIFVYFFLLETKGKSLEDIVDELNGNKKESPTPEIYTIKL